MTKELSAQTGMSRGWTVSPWRIVATFSVAILVIASVALAQFSPERPSAPTAIEQVEDDLTPSSDIPLVRDTGQIQNVNWFSDWQTCIWGIGGPSALAWRNPVKAKRVAWNLAFGRGGYNGLAAVYGHHVADACWRFIYS